MTSLLMVLALATLADDPYAETVGREECGVGCLLFCASDAGKDYDYDTIKDLIYKGQPSRAITLEELSAAAEKLGLETMAVRWNDNPPDSSVPAIIPINAYGNEHYIVLLSIRGRILVVDPPSGPQLTSLKTLRDEYKWDGTTLYVGLDSKELSSIRRKAAGSSFPLVLGGLAAAGILATTYYRSRRAK